MINFMLACHLISFSTRKFEIRCDIYTFFKYFHIDLKTMTDRLKAGYYSTKKLFAADMMRIFNNCRTYNAPDTEYYRCANTMERYFLSKMKEIG